MLLVGILSLIVVVNAGNTITTYAGLSTGASGYSGNGGQATSSALNSPYGVWGDAAGTLYIVDSSNCVIRNVSSSGIISNFAGSGGLCGYSGDNGPATLAYLMNPTGIWGDASNLYIADNQNNMVRKVSFASGVVTTYAGTGTGSFFGDGIAAT